MKAWSAAGVLLLALCSFSRAAELSMQGTNKAEFWLYEQDYATHLEDKLDLNLRYGDLRGGLGLFLYEPSKPWDAVRQPLRLLDYTVAYSPKMLEVLYGKFFQTFGKGLALRTYSDDDFRHYKSLNGLRFIGRLPRQTELVLLGARMRDIFFQENAYRVMNADSVHADTNDQVLGANLSSRPFSFAGFGGRYVRVNRTQDPTPKAFNELFGGDATISVGPVEIYGEVCQRLGTKPYVGGREKGFGYYLTGTVAIGSYSIVGEYVDYDKLGFPDVVLADRRTYRYTDPPTPIKSGVAINRGVDERGFGVTASGTPTAPLYVEASLGSLSAPRDSTKGVIEGEGKVRYSLGTDWTFEAKFNHMVQENIELHVASRATDKPTIHANYLFGQHTFAFEAEYNFVTEDTGHMVEPWKYHEAAISASYGYGEALLFTVGYQFVDMKLDRRFKGETSWPVVEAVWSITERNMLRVRIGSERGGYTCSGGVCREEAPFSGIKAQLISTF
ncbi:hypothetical protein FJY68_01740 [candidate division WOR-3 bacterium]|uniref:Uncharacterized protein n=1 Tax=candidate division WOR-3 bacterium TaxID=2052148 RepID=A0A937XC96_UNCW3|nr:hypothetical protein [candidate division WOR-3 bacterium]